MKYSLNPDPFSSHSRILALVRDAGPHKRILDVGCASGFLERELAGFDIVAIEKDPVAAQAAEAFCRRVIVGDIEQLSLGFPEPFDIIILGDVVEHLARPEVLLQRLRACLHDHGMIIVSVPNVANIAVRLSLLVGRFEYMEKGPLDRTHLRFFTWKSAVRLLEGCGFRVRVGYATPVPLPLLVGATARGRPLYPLHVLNYVLCRAWQKLLGYQFVFVAVPFPRAMSEPVAGHVR